MFGTRGLLSSFLRASHGSRAPTHRAARVGSGGFARLRDPFRLDSVAKFPYATTTCIVVAYVERFSKSAREPFDKQNSHRLAQRR